MRQSEAKHTLAGSRYKNNRCFQANFGTLRIQISIDFKKESGTNVNGDKKDCGLCSGEMWPVAAVEALHLKSTRISALVFRISTKSRMNFLKHSR